MARPELDHLPQVAVDAANAFNMQVLVMTGGPQIAAAVASMQTAVTLHEGQHAGAATTGNDVGKSGSREI